MADKLLKFATTDPKSRKRFGGDSVADQLSSVHTFYILLVFAVIVQASQLMGDTIDCWCPAHFTGPQSDYTDSICWTTNTYYLPFSEEIPKEGDPRKRVSYYQWISLILIFQAVLFYFPKVLWRFLSKQSGIAVSTITDAALDCQQQTDWESKDKSLRYMVKHFGKFLLEINRHHLSKKRCRKCFWKLYGHYLSISYLFLKLVYLTNVVGQLYLLNIFLDLEYNFYGIYIIKQMIKGEEWRSSDTFPRVTFCDFKIRLLGNVQRYTVQCSLPMNLFNEIIFIFIWFWFVFVAIVTVISVLGWLYVIIYKKHNYKYIKSRLVALNKISEDMDSESRRRQVKKFIEYYLRTDGCFVIQLVSMNTSDLIAAEFIAGLWDHYEENQQRLDSKMLSESDADLKIVEEETDIRDSGIDHVA